MPDPSQGIPDGRKPMNHGGDEHHPQQVEIGVTQRAEDLTGVPRVDATIKIVKYLGFPIAAAIFGLYVIYLVVGDYRESVKASTAAQATTALAVVKQSDDMDDIKLAQESQKQAMWRLREGQVEQLDIQKDIREGILEMVAELKGGVKTKNGSTQ